MNALKTAQSKDEKTKMVKVMMFSVNNLYIYLSDLLNWFLLDIKLCFAGHQLTRRWRDIDRRMWTTKLFYR